MSVAVSLPTAIRTRIHQLLRLSPSELISAIIQHENAQHNVSTSTLTETIQSIISSSSLLASSSERLLDMPETLVVSRPTKVRRAPRPFDLSRYSIRNVALRIMYDGSEYHGLTIQKQQRHSLSSAPTSIVPTVESHLFDAFRRARLIADDSDERSIQYTRCGRTDRGVHANGQIVSACLRSADTRSDKAENDEKSASPSLDYVTTLNRILPNDIRVVMAHHVPANFNARFDCKSRTYQYIFYADRMDIDAMQRAANSLIGEHDFRNFCHTDTNKLSINYTRNISDIVIRPLTNKPQATKQPINGVPSDMRDDHLHSTLNHDRTQTSVDDLYECVIVGQSFLYHQVRCIMSVLFMVGRGLEQTDITKRLLDVHTAFTHKPVYALADERALILDDAAFDQAALPSGDVGYGHAGLTNLYSELYHQWRVNNMRAAVSRSRLRYAQNMMNRSDESLLNLIPFQLDAAARSSRSQRADHHAPLSERAVEDSFDVKIGKLSSRKQQRRNETALFVENQRKKKSATIETQAETADAAES